MLQQFDSQTNDSFERLSESNQTEPPVDIYGATSPTPMIHRSKDSLRFDIQISFGYKYAVRCHRHANNTE